MMSLRPMDSGSIGSGKKRKPDKDAQMNVCLAIGCDRQIKQRRLCPMHQKQKERNGGKIDLKETVKFAKGRTPTPFSKHANKYAKLKTFDKKIDEWAGMFSYFSPSLFLLLMWPSYFYQNKSRRKRGRNLNAGVLYGIVLSSRSLSKTRGFQNL